MGEACTQCFGQQGGAGAPKAETPSEAADG